MYQSKLKRNINDYFKIVVILVIEGTPVHDGKVPFHRPLA